MCETPIRLFCAWYFEILPVELVFIQTTVRRWLVAKQENRKKKYIYKRQNEQTKWNWEGRGWHPCSRYWGHEASPQPSTRTTTTSRQGNAKAVGWRASAARLMAAGECYLAVGKAALKCRSWAAETSCFFSTSFPQACVCVAVRWLLCSATCLVMPGLVALG